MILEFYTSVIDCSGVYCDNYRVNEKGEYINLYRKCGNHYKVGVVYYKLYKLVRLIDNDGKVSIIYKKE